MPKISIILPVYNVENYIARCMNSILAQNFRDYELIVVNDGSTDGSIEICESYKDSRIVIIDKKNRGVSSARNVGIEIARGEYITFIDSDDYISHNYLSDLMKTDTDLVCQTAVFISEKGVILHIPHKNALRQELIDGDLPNNILNALYVGWFNWTVCKRFKKSIIYDYDIRFDENLNFAEDTLFTVTYADKAKSIMIDNIANYYYVQYNTRQTLSNDFSVDKVRVLEKSNHMIARVIAGENTDLHNCIFAKRMADIYNSMIGFYIKNYSLCEYRRNVLFVYMIANDKNFISTCKATDSICLPRILKKSVIENKKKSIGLVLLLYSVRYYLGFAYHQARRLVSEG